MYLMIENKGVAPKEAYTLLGASTARGKDHAIGQFGTGSKHAITLLLREGISPTICLGGDVLTFGTRKQLMQGCTFDRVTCNNEDLGFVGDFGAIDWTDPAMAMREFISNAIDQSDDNSVSIQNTVEMRDDYTRVFIPLSPSVMKFYSDLSKWFLKFDSDYDGTTIIPKKNRNISGTGAVIYRKGVRVREYQHINQPSLWDYNLNDLVIDEVRKANDWEAQIAVAQAIAIADIPTLIEYFESFNEGKEFTEHHIDGYYMIDSMKQNHVNNWSEAFYSVFGEKACVASTHTAEAVTRKGFTPVVLPSCLQRVWEHVELRQAKQVIGTDEMDGRELEEIPDPTVLKERDRLWNLITSFGMTNSKIKPTAKVFHQIMNGGTHLCGYYRENTIYINRDVVGSGQTFTLTVLEELVHHITGATDNSRDFQDYLLRLIVTIID